MNVRLTKWFLSAAVLAVVLVLALPSTSSGWSVRFVQLADDPNEPGPEFAPFESGRIYLEDEPNEPGPEFAPFDGGRTYLDGEPNEPGPEFCPGFGRAVLLDIDPNEPGPECY